MKTKRFRSSEKQMAAIPTRRYETKLDQKKRVVLRGARHTYYEVREEANGSFHLTPKQLVDIEPISARTLAMLDSSAANFKKGIASEPIDLTELRKEYGPRKKPLTARRIRKVRRHSAKRK